MREMSHILQITLLVGLCGTLALLPFLSAGSSLSFFFLIIVAIHPSYTPLTPFPFLAMGCPHASKDAAVCSEDALSAFFNTKHPGQYMIINLSEKQYDYSKFDDQV